MGKTRMAVMLLNQKLDAHTIQDNENFNKMDRKLDTITEKVAALDALQSVASKAGSSAGRSSAWKWSGALGTILPIIVVFFLNSCFHANLAVPVAPASVAAPPTIPNVP